MLGVFQFEDGSHPSKRSRLLFPQKNLRSSFRFTRPGSTPSTLYYPDIVLRNRVLSETKSSRPLPGCHVSDYNICLKSGSDKRSENNTCPAKASTRHTPIREMEIDVHVESFGEIRNGSQRPITGTAKKFAYSRLILAHTLAKIIS